MSLCLRGDRPKPSEVEGGARTPVAAKLRRPRPVRLEEKNQRRKEDRSPWRENSAPGVTLRLSPCLRGTADRRAPARLEEEESAKKKGESVVASAVPLLAGGPTEAERGRGGCANSGRSRPEPPPRPARLENSSDQPRISPKRLLRSGFFCHTQPSYCSIWMGGVRPEPSMSRSTPGRKRSSKWKLPSHASGPGK